MTISDNELLQRISISLERIADYMKEKLELEKFHKEEYLKAKKENEKYFNDFKERLQKPINKNGVN